MRFELPRKRPKNPSSFRGVADEGVVLSACRVGLPQRQEFHEDVEAEIGIVGIELDAASGVFEGISVATQQVVRPLPEYTLLREEGADHVKIFHVQCRIADEGSTVEASGKSRRRAEQAAAAKALELLHEVFAA